MRLSSIISLIASLALAGAILCWVIALTNPGIFYTEFLIGIGFLVCGCGLAALPCAKMLERGKMPVIMWAGIAASTISAIGWGLVIWRVSAIWAEPSRPIVVLLSSISVFAGWTMLLAMLMANRLTLFAGRIVRGVTLVFSLMLAITVLNAIMNRDITNLIRTISVLAVLTLFGLLLTMILARLKQLTSGSTEDDEIIRKDFVVWCPRCSLQQSLQTGGAHCADCGLQIKVMVE